jgi:hypothetical protein
VDMLLTTTLVSSELVGVIAAEMASGVETAVECWMAQIEQAFEDTHLTTLGRLNAVGEILDRYKRLTGKTHLECRRA